MECDKSKFTWFPKFTETLEEVPEDQRGILMWAILQYGSYDIEPDLEYPLSAIFASIREDIDNSKQARIHGKAGGRSKQKENSDEEKGVLDDVLTPIEEVLTPLEEVDKGGSVGSQPIPIHTIPIQDKPKQDNPCRKKKERGGFRAPSTTEVKDYCVEKGYTFDAEQFVAFYESKGWKVGRDPMKSWQAACVTWHKREQPQNGVLHGMPNYD